MPARPAAAAAERLRLSLRPTPTATDHRLKVAVLAEISRRVAAGIHRRDLTVDLDVDLDAVDGALAGLGTWLAQRAGGAPAGLRPPGFTRAACGRDIARSVAAVAHHAPGELVVARWLAARNRQPPPVEPGWALVAGLGALWRSPFAGRWDEALEGAPVAPVALALWDELDALVAAAVDDHRRLRRQTEPPADGRGTLAAALDEVAFTRATAGGRDGWARYRSSWRGPYPRGPEDLGVAQLVRLWELRPTGGHDTAVA